MRNIIGIGDVGHVVTRWSMGTGGDGDGVFQMLANAGITLFD
jgi:hypothetical protein